MNYHDIFWYTSTTDVFLSLFIGWISGKATVVESIRYKAFYWPYVLQKGWVMMTTGEIITWGKLRVKWLPLGSRNQNLNYIKYGFSDYTCRFFDRRKLYENFYFQYSPVTFCQLIAHLADSLWNVRHQSVLERAFYGSCVQQVEMTTCDDVSVCNV